MKLYICQRCGNSREHSTRRTRCREHGCDGDLVVLPDDPAEKLRVLAGLIADHHKRLSQARDVFRRLIGDFTDVLDSWDRGVVDIEDGVTLMNQGIDALSEHV